jgi:carbonic anhydrase
MPTPEILAGIGQFQTYFREHQDLYEQLAAKGQQAEVLFIGCSDSRVPIELLTMTDPGELFVARNVGNIVPPYGIGETAIGAIVEHAVHHLQVKHIVVSGHTDCGGIKTLDEPANWSREPHLARWIEHARPAKTKVEASGLPEEARHLATVRENVLLQMEHLRSYDPVREAERAGSLTVHGWVYHLETGTFQAYDPATGSWKPLSVPTASDLKNNKRG